ncbi:MAG: patatin-like phospholipase family protein [Myxococcales bacterium]|nr:patatin-like phospholipase family protein [Myxococcales bacterium]
MAKYRILSLDGGGVRGVYTAVLLKRLEARAPGFLASIDLFAGTSTGGIIALALAFGLTPDDLIELYHDNAEAIFADSIADDMRDLGKLLGADYDQGPLRKLLEERFGDKVLGDLVKRVLISAFDLDPGEDQPERVWQPRFFHNYPPAPGKPDDRTARIVDVALATSAAPTFFPSYRGYVDGGVAANNPSMCALAQALDKHTGKQKLEDIRLLSLSTGVDPRVVTGDTLDWGYVQWAPVLVHMMIEGPMQTAHYQCKRLLGETGYRRVAPLLPRAIGLDGAKHVADLIEYANDVDLDAPAPLGVAEWVKAELAPE